MIQIKRATLILAAATLVWMFCIFRLSAQNVEESSDFSDAVTRFLLNILEPGEHTASSSDRSEDSSGMSAAEAPDGSLPTFSANSPGYDPVPKNEWFGIRPVMFKTFVRKAAHFTSFLLLGVLTACTLFSYDRRLRLRVPLFSWLFCILYALLDEFHQLFVEGRGAEFSDVCLDSAGAFIGVCLATMGFGLVRLVRKRRRAAEEI